MEREITADEFVGWMDEWRAYGANKNQGLKECYTDIHLKVSTPMNHKSFLNSECKCIFTLQMAIIAEQDANDNFTIRSLLLAKETNQSTAETDELC